MQQKMTFYGYCSQQFSESFLKSWCSMPLSLGSTSSPEGEDSHNEWIIVCLAPVCTIISYFVFVGLLKCFCYVFHRVRQLWNETNHSDTFQQFNSHGLESSIIHSLLKSQFKKNNESENTRRSTDSAIFPEEFEKGQWLKHLPNCTHSFHVPCIDHWFQSQSNCPLCRSHVKNLITNQNVKFLWTHFWKLKRGKTYPKKGQQITRPHVPQSYKTLDLDVNQLMSFNLVNPMEFKKKPCRDVGMLEETTTKS